MVLLCRKGFVIMFLHFTVIKSGCHLVTFAVLRLSFFQTCTDVRLFLFCIKNSQLSQGKKVGEK